MMNECPNCHAKVGDIARIEWKEGHERQFSEGRVIGFHESISGIRVHFMRERTSTGRPVEKPRIGAATERERTKSLTQENPANSNCSENRQCLTSAQTVTQEKETGFTIYGKAISPQAQLSDLISRARM